MYIILVTDQFSLQQISNIAKQLKVLAPEGIISTKQFVEFFLRISSSANSFEVVSENYANADITVLQQVANLLDPFETGYPAFITYRLYSLEKNVNHSS